MPTLPATALFLSLLVLGGCTAAQTATENGTEGIEFSGWHFYGSPTLEAEAYCRRQDRVAASVYNEVSATGRAYVYACLEAGAKTVGAGQWRPWRQTAEWQNMTDVGSIYSVKGAPGYE